MNLYAASLRVCFLLFESMRGHLKFQLEVCEHCHKYKFLDLNLFKCNVYLVLCEIAN